MATSTNTFHQLHIDMDLYSAARGFLNALYGTENCRRYERVRAMLKFDNHSTFVAFLLDLAEDTILSDTSKSNTPEPETSGQQYHGESDVQQQQPFLSNGQRQQALPRQPGLLTTQTSVSSSTIHSEHSDHQQHQLPAPSTEQLPDYLNHSVYSILSGLQAVPATADSEQYYKELALSNIPWRTRNAAAGGQQHGDITYNSPPQQPNQSTVTLTSQQVSSTITKDEKIYPGKGIIDDEALDLCNKPRAITQFSEHYRYLKSLVMSSPVSRSLEENAAADGGTGAPVAAAAFSPSHNEVELGEIMTSNSRRKSMDSYLYQALTGDRQVSNTDMEDCKETTMDIVRSMVPSMDSDQQTLLQEPMMVNGSEDDTAAGGSKLKRKSSDAAVASGRRGGKVSCEVCHRVYPDAQRLANHMKRLHMGARPYRCDICAKSFTATGHLRDHMRTHTGEKPFTCEVCEQRFRQKQHMYQHQRKVHNLQHHKSPLVGGGGGGKSGRKVPATGVIREDVLRTMLESSTSGCTAVGTSTTTDIAAPALPAATGGDDTSCTDTGAGAGSGSVNYTEYLNLLRGHVHSNSLHSPQPQQTQAAAD